MNILVTGASGFIGSRVANFLSNKKFRIFCNYNNKLIKIKKVKKIRLSITKNFNIKSSIDVIIHCASKTPVNSNNNKITFNQNVNMMKSLINFSKKKNVKCFIFLSSMSAYGIIKKKILFESYKPYKPNSYGKSKIECEQLLIDYSKITKTPYLIIRLPGVVGLGSHSNFITEITKKIFKNEKIIVSNRNDFFNNIVFIDDLSKYILKIIKTKKIRYNLINLASKNKLKISNLINFIYEKLKIKNKKIIWIKNKKRSFTINLNKASQNGYSSSSVKKSLENYIMEIKNKL